MSLKSINRNWDFPSKTDSFDRSYDQLLSFFNTLDEEYGRSSDFLFGRHIDFFTKTFSELDSLNGGANQIAINISTGELFSYSLVDRWVKVGAVGRLPIVRNRNPLSNDVYGFIDGDKWVNSNTGEIFSFLGTIEISTGGVNQTQALWLSESGDFLYENDIIRVVNFLPNVSLNYITKTETINIDGSRTFVDNLTHISGTIKDGKINVSKKDTHIDLYIRDMLLGTIKLSNKDYYTFMDLDIFNPEGGLPAKGTFEIELWYLKFEKLLKFLNFISTSSMEYGFNVNYQYKFSGNIGDIINSNGLQTFIFENNLIDFTPEEISRIKDNYRSFFSILPNYVMSISEKNYSIYLIGDCTIDSFDGNKFFLDGNIMNLDGNINVSCNNYN